MEGNEPNASEEELPEAIVISKDVLSTSGVDIQELPAALWQKSASLEETSKEESPDKVTSVAPPQAEHPQSEQKPVARQPQQQERPSSSLASPSEPPAEKRSGESVNRKALEKTNRGVSPDSRRFVRGILHPAPKLIRFAAFCAIGVRVFFVLGIVVMVLFVLEKIEKEILLGLLLIPIFAIGYFLTAHKARCRVCGAKEFLPSGSRKHMKTHRLLGLGPIISTAMHLLVFKWFYCMFCGTAIRTKK